MHVQATFWVAHNIKGSCDLLSISSFTPNPQTTAVHWAYLRPYTHTPLVMSISQYCSEQTLINPLIRRSFSKHSLTHSARRNRLPNARASRWVHISSNLKFMRVQEDVGQGMRAKRFKIVFICGSITKSRE